MEFNGTESGGGVREGIGLQKMAITVRPSQGKGVKWDKGGEIVRSGVGEGENIGSFMREGKRCWGIENGQTRWLFEACEGWKRRGTLS